MKKAVLVFAALSTLVSSQAFAMCGCFMPPRPPPSMHVADSRITNKSSKVVIVHDGDRTVVTMANDFQGDAKQFAIVVPVPSTITRDQIHVGDKEMIETLAQSTAPQLLEYPGIDPCGGPMVAMGRAGAPSAKEDALSTRGGGGGNAHALAVKVEGSWTVGEYDIQILAAEDSDDLVTWLKNHDYAIPDGAGPVFNSYLRQNMRFFLAKVNLKEQAKSGYTYLRPLQIAYESPKFMLPIRLGMLNADGEQELSVWTVTKKGRVESTNYRTVKMPASSGMLPEYVKNDFESVYRASFRNLERREGNDVVFVEYAGNPQAVG
ncbi:MAG TPA: DUF2330 domain-containing protein, partial [bacterium]|nr:DUF2330 domain-containing protein [bacterium]